MEKSKFSENFKVILKKFSRMFLKRKEKNCFGKSDKIILKNTKIKPLLKNKLKLFLKNRENYSETIKENYFKKSGKIISKKSEKV